MPGLNLPTSATRKLTINGIYIADRTMTYNKSTGEMKYKVVFNKYVQVFDSKTIEAMVQGSGVFDDTLNDTFRAWQLHRYLNCCSSTRKTNYSNSTNWKWMGCTKTR